MVPMSLSEKLVVFNISELHIDILRILKTRKRICNRRINTPSDNGGKQAELVLFPGRQNGGRICVKRNCSFLLFGWKAKKKFQTRFVAFCFERGQLTAKRANLSCSPGLGDNTLPV